MEVTGPHVGVWVCGGYRSSCRGVCVTGPQVGVWVCGGYRFSGRDVGVWRLQVLR